MPDQQNRDLAAKDVAVLIPLLASALAISWEVGRFQVFGGFLLFSLSEHLLAAIEALPYALMAAAWFALLIPMLTFAQNFVQTRRNPRGFNKSAKLAMFAELAIFITVAGVAGTILYFVVKHGSFQRNAVLYIGQAVPVAVLFANAFWLKRSWASPAILSALGAASIFLAMMAGFNQSRIALSRIKDGTAARFIATLVSKDGTSTGFVLMAGERGFLIYFPDSDRFSFQKTDEFQRIEWQR